MGLSISENILRNRARQGLTTPRPQQHGAPPESSLPEQPRVESENPVLKENLAGMVNHFITGVQDILVGAIVSGVREATSHGEPPVEEPEADVPPPDPRNEETPPFLGRAIVEPDPSTAATGIVDVARAFDDGGPSSDTGVIGARLSTWSLKASMGMSPTDVSGDDRADPPGSIHPPEVDFADSAHADEPAEMAEDAVEDYNEVGSVLPHEDIEAALAALDAPDPDLIEIDEGADGGPGPGDAAPGTAEGAPEDAAVEETTVERKDGEAGQEEAPPPEGAERGEPEAPRAIHDGIQALLSHVASLGDRLKALEAGRAGAGDAGADSTLEPLGAAMESIHDAIDNLRADVLGLTDAGGVRQTVEKLESATSELEGVLAGARALLDPDDLARRVTELVLERLAEAAPVPGPADGMDPEGPGESTRGPGILPEASWERGDPRGVFEQSAQRIREGIRAGENEEAPASGEGDQELAAAVTVEETVPAPPQ